MSPPRSLATADSAPFGRSSASLLEGGRLQLVFGGLRDLLSIPWIAVTNSRKVIGSHCEWDTNRTYVSSPGAERGEFTSVIDRRYRFDEIVEARSYVDAGRKMGMSSSL